MTHGAAGTNRARSVTKATGGKSCWTALGLDRARRVRRRGRPQRLGQVDVAAAHRRARSPRPRQVRVDGSDLGALRRDARALLRRGALGFVFQFFNLIPTLTVAENVELPLALNGVRARGGAAPQPRAARGARRRRRAPTVSRRDLRRRAAARRDRARRGARAEARARRRAHRAISISRPRSTCSSCCRRPAGARQATLIMATHSREVARPRRPRARDPQRAHRGDTRVNRLLRRASLRFYLRHPWQLALAIARHQPRRRASMSGVELANDSAARAFELSAAVVRGTRDAPPAADRRRARRARVRATRRYARHRDGSSGRRGRRRRSPAGRALRVSVARNRPAPGDGRSRLRELRARAAAPNLARLIVEPGTVLLPEALAAELGAAPGDSADAARRAGATRLVRRHRHGARASARDVAGGAADRRRHRDGAGAARQRRGCISRIDLALTRRASRASSRADPPPARCSYPPRPRTARSASSRAAFRTNLTALGLLALVVGMFLIYGTMSFAVVQRRATLGVLRALGVTRAGLLGYVLLEALALAVVRDRARAAARSRARDGARRARAAHDRRSVLRRGRHAVPPSPGSTCRAPHSASGRRCSRPRSPRSTPRAPRPRPRCGGPSSSAGARRGDALAALAAAPLLAASALLLATSARASSVLRVRARCSACSRPARC